MNTGATDLDILLVCGARPILLRETLRSFSANVFPYFKIGQVYANVDQFQGDEQDVAEVVHIIREHFPSACIRQPSKSSFTSAVKWLWASASSPYCLHLEDDWVAEEPIYEEMVLKHFEENVAQVSILVEEKQWKFDYPFHCKWTRHKFLGIKFGRRLIPEEPLFTTSPSFLTRSFANTCSSLMIESLDPEKQLYDGRNEPLRTFTKQFRNRLLKGNKGYIVRDIGRAYRAQSGLQKVFEEGKSVWKASSESLRNGELGK